MESHYSDSYLLNSSTHPSVNRTLKLNRYHPNPNPKPKHTLSHPSPLLISSISLTKLTSSTKPKLKLKLKSLSLFITLPISLCAVVPLNVNAALSATTVNTIQGSKPYLTFDKGKTRAIDTKTLLSLTLSNGITYTQNNNVSSVSNPIVLPVSGQTLDDVKLFIPTEKNTIALNDLINEPYDYWEDDDGDGQGVSGIHATGNLSVAITDIDNKSLGRGDRLDPCYAPFKMTLSATEGELSTQYGDPNLTEFNASKVEYYIQPKVEKPYACFAKPNLEFNFGTQPEWDDSKGFKLQSLSEPKKNFPRTGFHGAFFDITIAGETAKNVIAATGNGGLITQGGVTATLTEQGTNVVRVTLTGPNNASRGGAFTPSTFRIKSNSTNDVYNFEISKWFIATPSPVRNSSAATAFCKDVTGNYRVPSLSEYTNGNGLKWTGGLSGQESKYARAIGNGKRKTVVVGEDDGKGGLFTEWGNTYAAYYTDGDFINLNAGYWTVDYYNSDNLYRVSSSDGHNGYAVLSDATGYVSCVTP